MIKWEKTTLFAYIRINKTFATKNIHGAILIGTAPIMENVIYVKTIVQKNVLIVSIKKIKNGTSDNFILTAYIEKQPYNK